MQGGEGKPPNVPKLTAMFFSMYFLMATQDIAVDGWARTMLSPPHVEKGSTMNVIGQNLGSFLGFVFFLALNDADTCNTYLRSVPSDEPLVTLGSFLSFFGWALVLTTISVAVFRAEADDGHGEGETGLAEPTKPGERIAARALDALGKEDGPGPGTDRPAQHFQVHL